MFVAQVEYNFKGTPADGSCVDANNYRRVYGCGPEKAENGEPVPAPAPGPAAAPSPANSNEAVIEFDM